MQVKSVDEYFPTYRKLWDYNRHILRDPSQHYRACLFDCRKKGQDVQLAFIHTPYI